MILAIDLGTKMGWACKKQGAIFSGVENFKNDRFQGGGMRFLRFSNWLDRVDPEPVVVYFEEVRRHLGVDAAHAYGGFLATLTSWCELNMIPYEGVPVGTIKQFITGKGNASKEAIIKEIKKRGFNPTDDNEADAITLLLLKTQ